MTVAGGVAGPARARPSQVHKQPRADAPMQRVGEHDDPEGGGAHRLAQPPALHGRGRPSRLRCAVCVGRVAVWPQPDVLRPGAEHECRDRHVGKQRDSGAQPTIEDVASSIPVASPRRLTNHCCRHVVIAPVRPLCQARRKPKASTSVDQWCGSDMQEHERANAAEQTAMLRRPPKRSTARPIGIWTAAPRRVPAM
eukprot:scaffold54668_cov66-Phaeocystis_antarctica.AAC.2